ncbi:hypothetical protein ACFRAQ_34650 [Nocardia sp. NPDC056611]|uniref:hypothetical protein n=1 Tax=Nocardia sp. NPDC056611 TaxID=3345877 RepID=UPI003670DAD2
MTEAELWAEQDLLTDLLESIDWDWLTDGLEGPVAGFEYVDSYVVGKTRWNQCVEVITRGPSGQHYAWTYANPLTELQEVLAPRECGLKVRRVKPVEEMVVVRKWVNA